MVTIANRYCDSLILLYSHEETSVVATCYSVRLVLQFYMDLEILVSSCLLLNNYRRFDITAVLQTVGAA